MITIARFSKPEDAHLLRMRLEAGGVPAFLQDENIVQVDWLYSNAIGGVRVQVAEEDLAKARELMEEGVSPLDNAAATQCPFCGSEETEVDELPRRLTFLSILLLAFPVPFLRPRHKCRSCGRHWREKKRT